MFGAGILSGMRINISKNHMWFIDLALGGSYNYTLHVDNCFIDNDNNY